MLSDFGAEAGLIGGVEGEEVAEPGYCAGCCFVAGGYTD